MKLFLLYIGIFIICFLSGCRDDIVINGSEGNGVTDPEDNGISGFYLLNEGNMGSNKCSLDYFDELLGVYTKNIYAERNPSAVKELGDVGNDLVIYGSKLYAVINCSHKVEVMKAADAKRITQIDVPNCRYLCGYKNHIYVSSYVGGAVIDPKAQRGAVYKIDTLTYNIVGKVDVGYQPEEMAIVGDMLYVANSGGYRAPDFDNTVTVIDLLTFTNIKSFTVADNLHRVKADKYGRIYVSNRTDNYGHKSKLHIIDAATGDVEKVIDIPVDNIWVEGDSAYIFGTRKDNAGKSKVQYSILDLQKTEVVNNGFITDGTDVRIKVPYGIAVHPVTKDIYITDAKNYVTSGTLYCFSKEGVLKWQQLAGNIPSNFAFMGKK